MSQHLKLEMPNGGQGRYGPMPGTPEKGGFGIYAHMGTPGELLAQQAGLAMFQEGTVINEGLTKLDGGMPTLGHDYRPWFLKYIRHRVIKNVLRTKGYLDSTAALIHTTTDQEIIDTTRRETPLMELIPMETARGKVASYDVLTLRGSAFFATEGITAQTPASDTYATGSKTLAIGTMWGGWTDFGLAAGASQYPTRDYRAIEIRNKTWSMNETWENELLNGSTPLESAFNTGGSNTGFIGLRGEIISSSTLYPQLQATLSNNDPSDTDIDSMIAAGTLLNVKYNLAITDMYTWQKLKQLMMGIVRYVNPETEIAWGLKALAWNTPYGVMPIVASKFMPTTTGSRDSLSRHEIPSAAHPPRFHDGDASQGHHIAALRNQEIRQLH